MNKIGRAPVVNHRLPIMQMVDVEKRHVDGGQDMSSSLWPFPACRLCGKLAEIGRVRGGGMSRKGKVELYDPDQRALEKALSRRLDEEALSSGRISREEMQHTNGGYGMFRDSKLIRRGKKNAAHE